MMANQLERGFCLQVKFFLQTRPARASERGSICSELRTEGMYIEGISLFLSLKLNLSQTRERDAGSEHFSI